MKYTINLDTYNKKSIKNEDVKGLLLTVKSRNTSDDHVTITDLNKIQVSLELLNDATKKTFTIFKGFLGQLLSILYSQDPRYDIAMQVIDKSYQIFIPFMANHTILPISLKKDFELVVGLNFPLGAFNTGISKTASEVEVETVNTTIENYSRTIPTYEVYPVEAGNASFDEYLGDNVVRAVFHVDDNATYTASTKAKPTTVTFEGSTPTKKYNKSVSVTQVLNQNRQMLAVNPDTELRNLVIYMGEPLRDANAEIQMAEPSSAGQVVSVTRLVTI